MNTPNDGGPAFPRPYVADNETSPDSLYKRAQEGMSFRRWLAGQALAGEVASQGSEAGVYATDVSQGLLEDRAAMLWRFADAMISAEGGEK